MNKKNLTEVNNYKNVNIKTKTKNKEKWQQSDLHSSRPWEKEDCQWQKLWCAHKRKRWKVTEEPTPLTWNLTKSCYRTTHSGTKVTFFRLPVKRKRADSWVAQSTDSLLCQSSFWIFDFLLLSLACPDEINKLKNIKISKDKESSCDVKAGKKILEIRKQQRLSRCPTCDFVSRIVLHRWLDLLWPFTTNSRLGSYIAPWFIIYNEIIEFSYRVTRWWWWQARLNMFLIFGVSCTKWIII